MAKPGDLDDIGGDAPTESSYSPDEVISETIEIRERNGIRDLPGEDTKEAKGEAKAEGDGKPKPSDARPDGFVTKEERDRLARERDEYRAENRVLAERTQKLIDRFFAQQPQADQSKAGDDDPMPDYQNDPLGWIGWRQRQDQRDADQRAEQQKQWQQQEQEAREFRDTLSRATARFQKVIAERPEVNDLYNAVREHVAGLYAQNGTPAHQIPELVARYEADVIRWARQEYIPIEEALEQAAARFGVQMPAKTDTKPTPERDPATGQFVSEAEKAARVKESQERNASLSSAPGAAVKRMTPKELAQMPEEEMWRQFEAQSRRPGGKQFDRDMGFRGS